MSTRQGKRNPQWRGDHPAMGTKNKDSRPLGFTIKLQTARLDRLHKVNYSLAKENGLLVVVVVVDDLNVKGMMKNKKLTKHIANARWGTFVGSIRI